MKRRITNIPASIHARLLDRAKQDKRPFNELLQYFAMDRFLFRWTRTTHATLFVLKGAMMLRVWNASESRPTMDIDMLGKRHNDEQTITKIIRDVIAIDVESDGLVFDPDSVTVIRIAEDVNYHGLRINFRGRLGNAQIAMQVDIGYGDVIYPEAEITELPAVLDFPPVRFLCYSVESAIAEKMEAAVSLGDVNSRMKDFFDIWTLSRQFNFNGERLSKAIRLTFAKRKTELPKAIGAFTKEFVELKQGQWTAFRKKLGHGPQSFGEIVAGVELFLSPIAEAIVSDTTIPETWIAPGPWISLKD